MTDLKPSFEYYYPEGVKGGQCIVFLHRLVEFPPTGNYLSQKIATVKMHGILAADLKGNFEVGDVVITKENPIYGHGFCVNSIIGDKLQATESNYNLDERVHHTRLLSKKSPLIVGVLRGPLKIKIINNSMFFQVIKDKAVWAYVEGVWVFVANESDWKKDWPNAKLVHISQEDFDQFPTAKNTIK